MSNKFLRKKENVDETKLSFQDDFEEVPPIDLKKSIFSKLTPTNWIMAIIALIFIYLSTVLVIRYADIQRYEGMKNQTEMESIEVEREKKELEEIIKNAQNPEFIEKMARENLKMVKPDETVYLVVE